MAKQQPKDKLSKAQISGLRKKLLGWYDSNRRVLPWRAGPGQRMEPYKVWLSEIMLQQTTVGAVIPYFLKFLDKWPDVHALAAAPVEDVMREWAGLGYYARARNLHACATVVGGALKGVFPDSAQELKKLPGIGDYTAAAILAIAFNKLATVVDGNVERVVARLHAVEEPLPGVKTCLKELAGQFFDGYKERPGDLAQAFMDLGATVCIPSAPRCSLCPLSASCEGKKLGIAAALPKKARKNRPQRYGEVYWITDKKGRVLVHRRPSGGLLGGMVGLPTSAWEEKKARTQRGEKGNHIRHVFTHFELELSLKEGARGNFRGDEYFWAKADEIENLGFPTVFRKAVNIFKKNG